MLSYLLKNLPSKYVYAGYSVRKGLTIMTTEINGHIIYDVFEYTYLDNFLSFYLEMDNGNYKNVDYNIEVPAATAEDIMSHHITRGRMTNLTDKEYDKEAIVGVFGLRNFDTLIKVVDDLKAQDPESFDVKLEAMLDIKKAYMGVEIMGVINTFNKCLKYDKGRITVPPITNGPNDTYKSLIGDEMDFFDLISNKTSDEIVQELKRLDDTVDGVGNIKKEYRSTTTDVQNEKQDIEETYEDEDLIDTLERK